jgi:hypothetical protein
MEEHIVFEKRLDEEEIASVMRKIEFRGLYDRKGNPVKPYKNAKFTLVKVHPPEHPTSFPKLMRHLQPHPLFTAQPTIYRDQTRMLAQVDKFLNTIQKRIYNMGFEGIQYEWKGRGRFHVLPPIVEKHSYPLVKGALDLKALAKVFKGTYVKDAKGNLHEISKRYLRNYYVDTESKIPYLDVFNHNTELINYGLRFNGPSDFYIICDGSHRIDFALEYLDKPISVILVEGTDLFPYYALPMPFRPTTRLTSKEAEKMYPTLERDKVHLFNDFLKKTLHYNWDAGGLYVSKLRQNIVIH